MGKILPGLPFEAYLDYRQNHGAHDEQLEIGTKLDNGKNRLGLVFGDFAEALWEVGEVATHGAVKYSPGGWLHVEGGYERYLDAMYRHLIAHQAGELADQDSGHEHLAHAAWNMLAILQLHINSRGAAAGE